MFISQISVGLINLGHGGIVFVFFSRILGCFSRFLFLLIIGLLGVIIFFLGNESRILKPIEVFLDELFLGVVS